MLYMLSPGPLWDPPATAAQNWDGRVALTGASLRGGEPNAGWHVNPGRAGEVKPPREPELGEQRHALRAEPRA